MNVEKENLNKEEIIELTFDYFQRTIVHFAMWYAEARDNFGSEKAAKLMQESWEKSYTIQMNRMSKTLGFAMEGKFPKALFEMDIEKLKEFKKSASVNWLANDGIWFQTIEFSENMIEAKKCNDKAWNNFSPYEAMRIKDLLKLEVHPGLEGLKKALNFRLYADVNKQSIENETDSSFDFFMNECRVQQARNRKGLADYPCQSGGIIEYSTFAATIDNRIMTKKIACPPDVHPETWYCGWHFYTS